MRKFGEVERRGTREHLIYRRWEMSTAVVARVLTDFAVRLLGARGAFGILTVAVLPVH